jgi:hypothetical protein
MYMDGAHFSSSGAEPTSAPPGLYREGLFRVTPF